jgi:hypothetical protein
MNGGIIDRAEKGTKAYSEAEIGEQIKLAYAEWQSAQYTGETKTAADFVKDRLNSTYGEGAVTNVTETEGVFTVTFADGREYSYNVTTGTAEKIVKWNDNGNNTFTHSETGQTVEVGDTVYYNSGVAAYEGEGANQGKWGVLGVEDGKLLIMSKENVENLQLRGKLDYFTDGTTKLNNTCTPFKNVIYADSVRSIKIEDINKIIGYTPPAPTTYIYTLRNGRVYENNYMSNIIRFTNIDGTILTEENSIEVVHTYYAYQLNRYLANGSKKYNLLWNNDWPYWIDSSCIEARNGEAYWGMRVFTSR